VPELKNQTIFLLISFALVIYLGTFVSASDTTPPFSHWEFSNYNDVSKENVLGLYTLYYIEPQVTITLRASDAVNGTSECCASGVDKIYYRIWKLWDSQWHLLFKWKPYNNENIDLCQLGIDSGHGCDGKYEFEWYASDKAGNFEGPMHWDDIYVNSTADYFGINRITCDQRDGCYSGTYRDYYVSGKNCYYNVLITDNDNDGYDTQCDCDCNDSDPSVHQLINCSYNGSVCGDFQFCANNCPQSPQENCSDEIDNDCDGLVDCNDPDCIGQTGPNGGTCCQSNSDCNDGNSCTQDTCGADKECDFTSYCSGTDTSCGCSSCTNCNTEGTSAGRTGDGCLGDSYIDYYCSGTSCAYISHDCSDCTCSCGNYSVTESYTPTNYCSDMKDNDCNGEKDWDTWGASGPEKGDPGCPVEVSNAYMCIKCPDVNGDGKIDIFDLILISQSFNSCNGDPNYNSSYDLNDDGCVDNDDEVCLSEGWCTSDNCASNVPMCQEGWSPQFCPGETIKLYCTIADYIDRGVNSIDAYIGSTQCSWDDGFGWSDHTTRFTCTIPTDASGSITARCTVNTTKSYQSGSDQTTSISIKPISQCCSQHATQADCQNDPNCEWCPECSNPSQGYGSYYNQYNGYGDHCVQSGTCNSSYHCDAIGNNQYCGAQCDNTNGPLCDPYSSGDTCYYAGTCQDDCTCSYSESTTYPDNYYEQNDHCYYNCGYICTNSGWQRDTTTCTDDGTKPCSNAVCTGSGWDTSSCAGTCSDYTNSNDCSNDPDSVGPCTWCSGDNECKPASSVVCQPGDIQCDSDKTRKECLSDCSGYYDTNICDSNCGSSSACNGITQGKYCSADYESLLDCSSCSGTGYNDCGLEQDVCCDPDNDGIYEGYVWEEHWCTEPTTGNAYCGVSYLGNGNDCGSNKNDPNCCVYCGNNDTSCYCSGGSCQSCPVGEICTDYSCGSTTTTTISGPAVETLDPISVSSNSAILGGNVLSTGSYSDCEGAIRYAEGDVSTGGTESYNDTRLIAGDTYTIHITGLSPGTYYEYRSLILCPFDSPTHEYFGSIKSFTTPTTTSTTTTTISCDSTSYNTCDSAYDFGTSSGSKNYMCGDDQYYKVSTPVGKSCNITWTEITYLSDPLADWDLYVNWGDTCPTTSSFDCRDWYGGIEECSITDFSGTSYSLVHRYGANRGYYNISATVSCSVSSTTTTTTISSCSLDSASISSSCGPSGCNVGDKISLSGSTSGTCPTITHFQIDAKSSDGTCDIQFSGGDMSGIYSNEQPYVEVSTPFPVDAGYGPKDVWSDCSYSNGGWKAANRFCQCQGYSGALPPSKNPCYIESSHDRYKWDTSSCPVGQGSYTHGGNALTKVKCSSDTGLGGTWEIASIPSDCYGKTVSATYACIYTSGNPINGTQVDCYGSPTGSFTFVTTSTTTTTSTSTSTTTTSSTTTSSTTTTTTSTTTTSSTTTTTVPPGCESIGISSQGIVSAKPGEINEVEINLTNTNPTAYYVNVFVSNKLDYKDWNYSFENVNCLSLSEWDNPMSGFTFKDAQKVEIPAMTSGLPSTCTIKLKFKPPEYVPKGSIHTINVDITSCTSL